MNMFENNKIFLFIKEIEKNVPFFRYILAGLGIFIIISTISALKFPDSQIPLIWLITIIIVAILIIILSATLRAKENPFLRFLSYVFITVVVIIVSLGLIFLFTYTFFDFPSNIKFFEKKHQVSVISIGNFFSDQLMKTINNEVNMMHPDTAFFVVADLAGYGIFSHPEEFKVYIKSLKERRKIGSEVKCIFLNDQLKEKILAKQFAGIKIDNPDYREKVQTLLGNYYAKAVLNEKKELRDSLVSGIYTKNTFFKFIISIDREIIKDLQNAHITVKEYNSDLPIHVWTSDGRGGVITVVNFENPANETAFLIKGNTHFFSHIYEAWEGECSMVRN